MKKFKKVLRFKKWNVIPCVYKYEWHSNNFLVLLNAEDETECIAQCNAIFDYELNDEEVVIKDYSENEGMLEWLFNNKVIKGYTGFLDNGYVACPIVNLNLDNFIEINNK